MESFYCFKTPISDLARLEACQSQCFANIDELGMATLHGAAQ
jgi:hypothetical protein